MKKVAVTYDNGAVFQHFGHTKEFKVYEIEDNKIINSKVINSGDSGHGALATLLNDYNIDVLICGGIGGGAKNALAAKDIQLFGGVSGNVDDAIEAYIKDELQYNPNVACNHHGDNHNCSNHDHNCNNH